MTRKTSDAPPQQPPLSLFGLDRRLLARWFTLACFALPPVAGSGFSVILNGAGLETLVQVARRALPLGRDRAMIHVMLALYAYCGVRLLSLFANPLIAGWTNHLWPLFTLLAFPFLYSGWRTLDRGVVARAVVFGSMAACYGALVLAALQYHAAGGRAEGGAGNAIVFATVTCLAAPVALAGAFLVERRFVGWLLGAVAAGGMAALYSGSRISWVALLVALAAVLWVNRAALGARVSRPGIAIAALSLAALAVVAADTVPRRVDALAEDWRRISAEQEYDSSLGRRALLWQAALDLAREKPLIGHGPQFTKLSIRTHFPPSSDLPLSYTHFHNGYLTALAESGIAGLAALLALLAVPAAVAVRALRNLPGPVERLGAAMLLVVVATYALSGLTGIILGHDILDAAFVSFVAVGTLLAAGSGLAGPPASPPGQRPGEDAQVEAG